MSDFEIPPAAFIRLDLAPATLTGSSLPGGRLEKRRLIVTDAYVLWFADAPGGPVLENVLELVNFGGRATTGWDVEVEGGDVVHVSRSTGCLCGSRLKGLSPYPGVPQQMMG